MEPRAGRLEGRTRGGGVGWGGNGVGGEGIDPQTPAPSRRSVTAICSRATRAAPGRVGPVDTSVRNTNAVDGAPISVCSQRVEVRVTRTGTGLYTHGHRLPPL